MNSKRLTAGVAALAATLALSAAQPDTIVVREAVLVGPLSYNMPYMTSQKDAAGKEFSLAGTLSAPLSGQGRTVILGEFTAQPSGDANVASLTFRLTASGFVKAEIKADGADDIKVLVDGKEAKGETRFRTGTHRVDVLMASKNAMKPLVKVITSRPDLVKTGTATTGRTITLGDILDGQRIASVSLSSSGKYLLAEISDTRPGGATERKKIVFSGETGRQIGETTVGEGWWPGTDMLYATRKTGEGRQLVVADPVSGATVVKARNLPEGRVSVSPDGNFLLITTVTKGPKEGDVYQVLEPEDRQPGWRNRSSVLVYDLATGLVRPLTFGDVNTWPTDISPDGKKALVMTSRSRLSKRPTTVFDILLMDIATAKADTLVAADGFVSSASFSPDGSQVLVTGSPEALGGIGKNVPEGMIPSMSDGQMFVMNLSDRKINPVTRDFNPAVTNASWSKADGNIWFTAEDGDCIRLYTLNPRTGKFSVAARGEDLVTDFSLPESGSRLAWAGQGASNSDRLYLGDRKAQKIVFDAKKEQLADVKLGECHPWNYVNAEGDTIIGRYYLPADFDPSRKYPVIVNYYGGCSPSERTFESRYPQHLYAAQGYIVYVLNPRGATGRGQEFSAHHVNTAGKGVAEDIIGAVKDFLAQHPYANADKVGCIGASYGGFMTQYLLTQTPMFAAGISHAGISDHTSYWGEGYWGYSYSEVSMAESYPWSHRELYVDQSPLYNADKIHTPLLFLHGDADHNVPVGESIQMFTALKLLDRPTAFVAVKDQDHHILDYDKRVRWTDTIFAWFDKYLKGDPDQWESMYK